ncbi:MAG: DUF937 domain-containing protein [Nostoc sp. GBBB01]|jgi:hypothetical protein|uniref:DUF937 domain-containing protein n=1 Tax=Nostoc punctiforme FACHB-252 TaxID=1357509 RepID=A0ABR8HFS5_NOSPU|nr:DUF937 domain-containing protein [Nostoc punctiforme]MBD2614067.1 DUF937 domain-containing protein [Nostoc punctiforme FACHB-252]MBL1197699.1 DUF937 domain-containing protein [Nostoc sp. GBBB01]
MGLFFEVLSAINNPNQRGNVTQLESIINSVQQVATSRGIQPSQMQNIMSVVGNMLRPVLRQQQSLPDGNQLQNLISQAGSTSTSGVGMQSLLSPQLQQQIVQTVSQTTRISPNVIDAILPTVISSVQSMLSMGSTSGGSVNSNSILHTFLDSDRDGDTDLSDVLRFGDRFLHP